MKQHILRCGVALLLAVAVLVCFSGCGETVTTDASVESSEAPTPTTTTAAPTSEPAEIDPATLNPLTGLDNMNGEINARMVGVVIGNNWKSRPQINVDKADMYLEMETEGGITRLLAVFASASRMPEKIGPVRSARTPSVKMAKALDLVYCHAGGSTTGKAEIRSLDVADLDGLADSVTFWRDQALMNSKGMEYSMMTSGENVAARIGATGYRAENETTIPFVFGDKTGTEAGKTATIKVSSSQTVKFTYDDATGLYTKSNLTDGVFETHVSSDGNPIEVSNVVVLYARKYMENATTCDFDFDAGDGILISGGTSRPMSYTWSTSALSFTEEDGTPLEVATGKTYICIVNTALTDGTVIE